jgi:signal transduction histidine kinase
VSLSTRLDGDRVEIVVEDDGPGIAEDLRADVLERGVRADEAQPGSGLGLAIVRDLVALYGGTIELGTGASGGLRVALRVPGVPLQP